MQRFAVWGYGRVLDGAETAFPPALPALLITGRKTQNGFLGKKGSRPLRITEPLQLQSRPWAAEAKAREIAHLGKGGAGGVQLRTLWPCALWVPKL